MKPQAPVAAATLILLRPAVHAPFETLLIRRGHGMAFAGGAIAFPGGRIDPGDRALAEDNEEIAARIAAIRETVEEVGIAAGLTGVRSPAAGRRDLAELLVAGARFDFEALTPFSRWLPGEWVPRRFDTRFYLAIAPDDAEPIIDGIECIDAFWRAPAAVLAEADAGRHHMLPPTRMDLERLAMLPGIDAALAHARAFHADEAMITWIERRDDRDWVCIPEGRGYPATATPLPAAGASSSTIAPG